MTKIRFTVGMWLLGVVLAAAQNSTAPAPPAASSPRTAQFFAGAVVELDATHIKVTRTLVAHPTESRSFTITSTTKMNKSAVRLHSRVTVRYKHLADSGTDLALEIQPRPVIAHPPKM